MSLTEVLVGASCATLASVFLFPFKVEALLAGHTRRLQLVCLEYAHTLLHSPEDHALLHQKRLSIIAWVTLINEDSNAGRYEQANNVSRALRMNHDALTLAASGHTVERLLSEQDGVSRQALADIALPFMEAISQISGLDAKRQIHALQTLPDDKQVVKGNCPAVALARAFQAFTHELLNIL